MFQIKNGAKKVFIGGLPKGSTEEDIIDYFKNHELGVGVRYSIILLHLLAVPDCQLACNLLV